MSKFHEQDSVFSMRRVKDKDVVVFIRRMTNVRRGQDKILSAILRLSNE